MSDALLWELTKNNSSFLVKRNGLRLSSDPLNVANVHSFKFSGVNSKAVSAKAVDGKVVLLTKRQRSQSNKPKSQVVQTVLKSQSHAKSGNKAAKAVLAATAFYRGDLAKLAVARYHKLARGINNAKRGINKK